MYALHVWRNWALLPLDVWRILIAQTVTYAVLAGAVWGALVGAALIPIGAPSNRLRRGVSVDARAARRFRRRARVHSRRRGRGCVGRMPTPYFGGIEILVGTAGRF